MRLSARFIRKLQNIEPSLREVLLSLIEEIERQREESVTKDEFKEIKEILKRLAKTVNELAEAQRKTEERVNELAEAQKKTEEEVKELKEIVRSLAEAQRKTEERVNELAEAQKKTEEEVACLNKRMRLVEERLEGLSNTVGYVLEDRAYVSLPRILKERFGIEVEGRLIRRYVSVGKKEIQINLFGYGKKKGERVLILGECKTRFSKREIQRFEKYAKKIAEKEGLTYFPVLVAYDFHPKMEAFLKEKGIAYVWSYELSIMI